MSKSDLKKLEDYLAADKHTEAADHLKKVRAAGNHNEFNKFIDEAFKARNKPPMVTKAPPGNGGMQARSQRAGVDWVNLMGISDHGSRAVHESRFRIELDTPMSKSDLKKVEDYLAAGQDREAAKHLKKVRAEGPHNEFDEFIDEAFKARNKHQKVTKARSEPRRQPKPENRPAKATKRSPGKARVQG
jgi:hypothetical protein